MGRLHYSVWKNQFGSDSLMIAFPDSSFIGKAGAFSLDGISWFRVAIGGFTPKQLSKAKLDAAKISLNFRKSQNQVYLGDLHISVPDSVLYIDSIRYSPSISDETFFEQSRFRRTRFRVNIPSLQFSGIDCLGMLNDSFKARYLLVKGMALDVYLDKYKPFDESGPKPQMPNELISSLKDTLGIDSIRIENGSLHYSEQFQLGHRPGVLTFTQVFASIKDIATHDEKPVTTKINAQGMFMDAALMKLDMLIPLTSRTFSLRYSGSLDSMDVTKLNRFLEPTEYRHVNSGKLLSANYKVEIDTGRATGTLNVQYNNLSIAVLDPKTESKGGLLNKLSTILGKMFVIKGENYPGDSNYKTGKTDYVRKPYDYFMQIIWFAIRSGLGEVVGFG